MEKWRQSFIQKEKTYKRLDEVFARLRPKAESLKKSSFVLSTSLSLPETTYEDLRPLLIKYPLTQGESVKIQEYVHTMEMFLIHMKLKTSEDE